MNTDQFLKSNMKEYLNQDHGKCISCSECIKAKDRNIFYKYPKQMQSHYGAAHCSHPNLNTGRAEAFNLDKERQILKVPREIKRDFTTMSKATYLPYEVVVD